MRRVVLLVLVVSVLALGGCVENVPEDGVVPTTTHDAATPTVDGELVVHYIDVGQGDSTLLDFPNGETMLIDSGDWPQDGEHVLAYLEKQGIDRIDHLVATHPHADHIGGHEAVIEHFEGDGEGIGAAYDSGLAHTSGTFEEYLDAIERHDVDLFSVTADDELTIGNASVRFVNPPADPESGDLHANSVSLVVDYGETEFLFTGDLEASGEERVVENAGDALDSDVYQAGHHGSSTSSSPGFLDAVQPSIVVISSALDSQYGHPHEETLEAFDVRGYETYWTAVHGNITIQSNGTGMTVETTHETTTDPDALGAEKVGSITVGTLHPTGYVAGRPLAG